MEGIKGIFLKYFHGSPVLNIRYSMPDRGLGVQFFAPLQIVPVEIRVHPSPSPDSSTFYIIFYTFLQYQTTPSVHPLFFSG